jgi:hypothetical protein
VAEALAIDPRTRKAHPKALSIRLIRPNGFPDCNR